jgi:hypothetical protein
MTVQLLILIHAEEEFPWDEPFSRENRSVSHVSKLYRYQEMFAEFNASAGYAISYPLLEDKTAIEVLRNIRKQYQNVWQGIHCHPWVTPPYIEAVNNFNSYPGNLPGKVEQAKIRSLCKKMIQTLGHKPDFYLAGRYGTGDQTHEYLAELGIRYDFSPLPYYDYSGQDGPDFSCTSNRSWQCAGINIIPHSAGFTGWLSRGGEKPAILKRKFLVQSRISSVFSLLGGFSQVILSPEGFSLRDMKALTRKLVKAGQETLVLSFHSPSIVAGNTPFSPTESDASVIYEKVKDYLSFYVDEIGGQFLKLDHQDKNQ